MKNYFYNLNQSLPPNRSKGKFRRMSSESMNNIAIESESPVMEVAMKQMEDDSTAPKPSKAK